MLCLFYYDANKNEIKIRLSGDEEDRKLGVKDEKIKKNLNIV